MGNLIETWNIKRTVIATLIGAAALTAAPLAIAAPPTETPSEHSELLKKIIEAQPSCANFVRYDATNAYFGFGAYRNSLQEPRAKIPSQVQVTPLDGSAGFTLATDDSAVDLMTVGQDAYVLTYSGLELWDMTLRTRTNIFATYDIDRDMKYKEHAVAFARYKDTLIIAHGRIGVSFFDLKSHKLVQDYRLIAHQGSLQSMATGVTVQGNLAYVAVDNFNYDPQTNTPAFRGMVVIDMDTQQVVNELAGIDPGVTSITSDANNLVVTFGGSPLWKFDLHQLGTTTLAQPTRMVWKFPFAGAPIGQATMDDKYYYTCFVFPPTAPHGRYTRRPLALDRHNLILN